MDILPKPKERKQEKRIVKRKRNRIMSKAERYIELVSDENGYLCDQHALRAVEIAREEILLEVAEWIKDTFIFSENAKKDFSQTFNIKLL